MGLDMYLEARKYEAKGCWNADKPDLVYDPDLKVFEGKIAERNFKSISTKYQIGYFRKFNALHNYIVNEFADGVDECQPIYLGKEACHMILDALKSITKENADTVFPTAEGFFFGSTDYDDWYFEDVKAGIEVFTDICNLLDNDEHNKWEIIYQASW